MKVILPAILLFFSFIAKGQFPNLMVPKGHSGSITSVALSPNNKFMATIANDNTAILWDVGSGKELYIMNYDNKDRGDTGDGDANSIAFSPDGNYLLIYNKERSTPVVHRVSDGKVIARIDFNITRAEYSPDGRFIATGSGEGTVSIYDALTGDLVRTLDGLAARQNMLAFDRGLENIKKMADSLSKKGNNVEKMDTSSLKRFMAPIFQRVTGMAADKENAISSLAFSPNGQQIIVSSQKNPIKIFDLKTGKTIIFKENTIGFNDAQFSPNGKFAIAMSDNKTVNTWLTSNGKSLLNIRLKDKVFRAMFSPANQADPEGGRYILTSIDGRQGDPQTAPTLWNASNGRLFKVLNLTDVRDAVSYSPDGKYLFTANDEYVKIWDTNNYQLILNRFTQNAFNFEGFSRDSRYIFSDYSLWKAPTMVKVTVLKSTDNPTHINFANFIISGDTLKEVESRIAPKSCYNCTVDGRYKVEGGTVSMDSTMAIPFKITETKTGRTVIGFKLSMIDQMIFSPDSKMLALYRVKEAKTSVINLSTGKLINTFNGGLGYSKIFDPGDYGRNYQADSAFMSSSNNYDPIHNLINDPLYPESSLFSPDSRFLLIQTNDQKYSRQQDKKQEQDKDEKPEHGVMGVFRMGNLNVVVEDMLTGKVKSILGGYGYLGVKSVFSPPCADDPAGGRYVIIIDPMNNKADLWNTGSGRFITSLNEQNKVKKAMFSADSKYIITDEEGDFLKIWDGRTGKLIASYVDFEDSGIVEILPNGYYRGQKEAVKNLYYVTKDLKIITFDQLDIKYNRPDKVLAAFGSKDAALITAYKKAYQLRVKRLGIDTSLFNSEINIPDLDIVNKDNIENVQTIRQFKLHLKANAPGSKLERLNILLNGVPVFGLQGFSLIRFNKRNIDTSINITLSTGANTVVASAVNINGVESYRVPVTITYKPLTPLKARTYFIGIAADHYANSVKNLQWCVKDIRDFTRGLKRRFHENLVIDTLFDKNVTVENVAAIKQRLKFLTEDDKVIVVFSGHGLFSRDFNYYLSTYNMNFSKPEDKGLPYENLEALLDNIKPRKKLMLIDACHSGDYDKDELANATLTKALAGKTTKKSKKPVTDGYVMSTKGSFEMMRNLFVNVERNTGTIVIAASGATQLAIARSDLKNGVFMTGVLETLNDNSRKLKEFNANYDTWTVNALKEYLYKRVTELSGSYQQPVVRTDNIDADWDVWN